MKRNKNHYYPCDGPTDADGYGKTACGRLGRKTGGFIAFFFKVVKHNERCKICNKRFEKDQNEKNLRDY